MKPPRYRRSGKPAAPELRGVRDSDSLRKIQWQAMRRRDEDLTKHALNRRIVLRRTLAAAACSPAWLAGASPLCDLASGRLSAQPPGPNRTDPAGEADRIYVPDAIDAAVQQAVDYLVRCQASSGAIYQHPGHRGGNHAVALTALSVMALAAIGVQPEVASTAVQSPRENASPEQNASPVSRGIAMSRGIDFVLRDEHADATGYLGGRDGSRMYGHAIATLMLSEVLGMGSTLEQNARIRQALRRSIRVIVDASRVAKSSKHAGGWRYTPTDTSSDLSVTVWQVMALRSAHLEGVSVPTSVIEKAVDYLRRSHCSPKRPDGRPLDPASGFAYMASTSTPSFAMTAAGLLAMQVCGQYDSPLVGSAAEWLLAHPPELKQRYFFYGMYYYALAMHQAGGKYRAAAEEIVPELVMRNRRSDGSWLATDNSEKKEGPIYCTAMAALTLSVRYHYLPIYQR